MKSCRVSTGLSRAGVPPPSLQIFEVISGVPLLTGFHTSSDLVSHSFVNKPCSDRKWKLAEDLLSVGPDVLRDGENEVAKHWGIKITL